MRFNFYWIFQKEDDDIDNLYLELDWITVSNIDQKVLMPYTSYNFVFDIRPQAEQPGHYSIKVR